MLEEMDVGRDAAMKALLFSMVVLAGCSPSTPGTKTVTVTPFQGKLQWEKPTIVTLHVDLLPNVVCALFYLDGTPVKRTDEYHAGTFLVDCK